MTERSIYRVIFLCTFLGYVLAAVLLGTLASPPDLGDGQDYDAIAFNLWHHRGFGFDWNNPEWRKPYEVFPQYKDVLARHSDFQPTSYRPPGLPFLLAGVYSVAGRNFAAWRILNCAIVAGAATLAAAIAARFAGTSAAIISAILSLLSPQLIAASQRFLTEGMAAFFVALLAWTWLNGEKEQGLRRAAKLGIILGLLVATRSIFVLWIPLVLLVLNRGETFRRKWEWQPKAVCLLAFLLVMGPWWIRNIVTTKDFMPFGTEGPINLPAGFGPKALDSRGLWTPNDQDGAQELLRENLDPLTFEVRLAKFRAGLTVRWMREHPFDVLRLMFLHVWQELKPHAHLFSDCLLIAGGLAIFLFRKSPGIAVLALFLCMNIFGIALTWSVQGRFMVPVQPLLIALAGAMAAQLANRSRVILQSE